MTLEQQMEHRFAEYDVSEENQTHIKNFLAILEQRDTPTYEHSIRVGLTGADICAFMHLDPKVLFYAGTLHDIGKALIDPEVLQKTEGFDEHDMRQMKKHPEYGYKLLRGMHEFSAEVVLRHHTWQKDRYPKRLPKTKTPFSRNTMAMIEFYSRLLSLTDFHDALTSRKNDKFGKPTQLPAEKAKDILLANNQDVRYLINELYEEGIFGTRPTP